VFDPGALALTRRSKKIGVSPLLVRESGRTNHGRRSPPSPQKVTMAELLDRSAGFPAAQDVPLVAC